MSDLNTFNHIKDVLTALNSLRPSRFGYTEAAVNATGEDEVPALTGVYITEDSSQINSIPTPDQTAVDALITNIGLRSQAATLTRMGVNHFFGRLGLNLLKVTEKLKLLVEDHLVHRYITPSGSIVEKIEVEQLESVVRIAEYLTPLDASAPISEATIIDLTAADYGVVADPEADPPVEEVAPTAGIMSGADKRTLEDTKTGLAGLLDAFADLLNSIAARIFPVSQRNLVYNNDFRYFSNKIGTVNWYDYGLPDEWVYVDNGSDGKTGYDAVKECGKIQSSSDGTGNRIFKQELHGFYKWKNYLVGQVVTFKVEILAAAGVIVKLTDGVNTVTQTVVGTGLIEILELTLTVNSATTGLIISVEIPGASSVVELYDVYGNRGTTAIKDLQSGEVLDHDWFHDRRFVLKSEILLTDKPVGTVYAQYPSAASNDEATAFPTAERPATKFGGTWVELFTTDRTFFRTGGDTGQTRVNGYSLDQMHGHTHPFSIAMYYRYGTPVDGSMLVNILLGTGISLGQPSNSGYGAPRIGYFNESANRLLKIWLRTA